MQGECERGRWGEGEVKGRRSKYGGEGRMINVGTRGWGVHVRGQGGGSRQGKGNWKGVWEGARGKGVQATLCFNHCLCHQYVQPH